MVLSSETFGSTVYFLSLNTPRFLVTKYPALVYVRSERMVRAIKVDQVSETKRLRNVA